jgi:hypothetical protein
MSLGGRPHRAEIRRRYGQQVRNRALAVME